MSRPGGALLELAVDILFFFAPFLTVVFLGVHVYQVAQLPGESHDHH